MAFKELNIKNKKAYFDYEIIDEYIAGIQLLGTEIKSIRDSKASIKEAYCAFERGELFVIGMYVAEYEPASYNNHEVRRKRKLLLQSVELKKLEKKLKQDGGTIIPLKLFLAKSGYVKLKIAYAKGKKKYDKRESLKEKDAKRRIDRVMK
jgi:SsrA-binding protein